MPLSRALSRDPYLRDRHVRLSKPRAFLFSAELKYSLTGDDSFYRRAIVSESSRNNPARRSRERIAPRCVAGDTRSRKKGWRGRAPSKRSLGPESPLLSPTQPDRIKLLEDGRKYRGSTPLVPLSRGGTRGEDSSGERAREDDRVTGCCLGGEADWGREKSRRRGMKKSAAGRARCFTASLVQLLR